MTPYGKRIRMLIAGLLVGLFASAGSVSAQPRPTRVLLSPATLNLADQAASTSLLVDGAPSLSRFDITLSWNPEHFALTAVNPLGELSLQDDSAGDGAGVLVFDYDREAGTIRLSATMPGSGDGTEGEEAPDADAPPPEAPPVATTIGLDEGSGEHSLVALVFAALSEGESPLRIEPEESTLYDAEGVPIDVAAFEDATLLASLRPDPELAEAASAEAAALAELGGSIPSGSGGLAVIGDATRRVLGDLRDAFGGDGDDRSPRILWLGALLGGALLAWLGWAIGREPTGDEVTRHDTLPGPPF